jgi:hypothetical protein
MFVWASRISRWIADQVIGHTYHTLNKHFVRAFNFIDPEN